MADAGSTAAHLAYLAALHQVFDLPAAEIDLVPGPHRAATASGQGRLTDVLVAHAALRARLLLVVADVHRALGDEKAAEKAHDAAEEALEVALTDRDTANEFLAAARGLLRRARGEAQSRPGSAPSSLDPAEDSVSSGEDLARMRSELRR